MSDGNLHFWKRFMIFPGLWLNISKSGISFSFGTRCAKITVSKNNKKTLSLGIPGSGLFFRKKLGKK